MSIMQKHNNPFATEAIRAELAKDRNFDELRKMYAASYPEISDHNTPKFWDGLNVPDNPVITDNPMEKDRHKIVSRLIMGEHLSIVHIGFGSGNLEHRYFQSHSQDTINWHGIDISPASVQKVQRDFPKGKFEIGDIVHMKLPSDHFDYAIASEVLEHIPPRNTFKALSEVFRVVKPGGYFIISVPLNEGLEEMIARGENPNAHVRIYTPELIKTELRMTGFTILDEKKLFAFHKWYSVKTVLAKYVLFGKYKPNNIILRAQKPVSLS
jgi:ubiquinone/menaquinone biosynthesis C-methylase UbiE